MLKDKITQILTIFLCIVLVIITSCSSYQDKGNYDYNDINQVSIKGIEKEYSVVRGEKFSITPELKYTKDSKKYSYKWQFFKINSLGLFGDGLTDLSSQKNLIVPVVSLKPGSYASYYTVKDLITGLSFQYKFRLNVVSNVYEGWLLLSEVNGGSRLDMVSFLNGKHKLLYDALKVAKSKLILRGSPKFVYTYHYWYNDYGVYLSTTGNGTVRLGSEYFDLKDKYHISSEFLSKQPKELGVDNIFSINFGMGFIVRNGDVFFRNYGWQIYYDFPINKIDGKSFKVSPMAVQATIYPQHKGNNTIFYDKTNNRFLQVADNGFMTGIPKPKPSEKKFDYDGKDRALVYMDSNSYLGKKKTTVFAVLKNTNDNKYYLAVFNAVNFSQIHYGEIKATDFDKATNYAISPQFGYLFYSVEGKVYEYDFSTKNTKLMFDKGPEKITLLKFQRFFNGEDAFDGSKYEKLRNQLIVCSYDPSKPEGSNGTMELYEVPSVHGDLVLKNKYTGFGKIKSISYRER